MSVRFLLTITSRQRSEGERGEESQLLDQAYVVFERYQKRGKLFAELRSMRYRCMASFGGAAAEPFDDISNILNEIFVSARMLGSHYWPRQGRVEMSEVEFNKHLEQMQKHEAVYWYMGDDKDEISPRVKQAVSKMESIAKDVILSFSDPNKSLIGKVVHWFKRS